MKICPECGTQQPDNNRSCFKCGAFLPKSSKSTMRDNFSGLNFDNKKDSENTFMQDRIREKYGDSCSNNPKKQLSASAAIIGVACIIICIIMICTSLGAEDTKNTYEVDGKTYYDTGIKLILKPSGNK